PIRIFKPVCSTKISIKSKIMSFIFIKMIKMYQIVLSPFLGSNCRYQPTCSNYAIESIEQWGVIQGSVLSFKRIIKCHPWGSSGYDGVPTKHERTKNE
ncbi:MAG: membrane protein insertion efficiency factor YidD, partial [Candidatus Neomarinimicrobiota bacterium]|nr:membrane protein insertion efficiency factor YidD [Candidatus Neomarinimicrobiota bacterium]